MSSPLGLTAASSAMNYSGSNHALALHHVFGLKGDVKDNIQYVEESEVVYPCGRAIVAYNIEKKSQRFIHLAQPSNQQQQQQQQQAQASPSQPNSPTSAGAPPFSPSSTSMPSDIPPSTPSLAAQSSYAAGPASSHVLTIQEGQNGSSAMPPTAGQITAMALSNSKTKLLAVAESSDRGLIWVYDAVTHKRKTKVPLQCPEMGSHEWVSLAFSPDGKQLLALGGAPDWLLVNFLWERGKPLQMAQVSNQNGAAVYQCSYCPLDPTCVCVTGQGILRFLRLEQNDFKSIQFNIGKREPQNYLCHAWMEDRVLIGTDTGDILVFENGDFFGVLASSPANGKSINSIAPYTKGFVCGCDQGVLHVFERDEKDLYKRAKSFQIDGSLNLCRIRNLAISPSEDNVACTLDNCQAFVFSLSNTDILKAEDMNFEPLAVSFHVGSVTGLDVCMRKPLVVTCGSDRSVRVWNYLERSLELVKFFKEEPLSVAIHPSGLHLLVGFNDCLALLNLLMEEMRVFREFPVKQCREVRFSNGGQYFAIANGAVVQLFSTYSCEPIGNLRGHKARIRSLSWSHDDSALVSTDSEGQMYEWRLKEGSHVQDYNATTGQSHTAGTSTSTGGASHSNASGFASTAASILSNSNAANGTNTTAGMALGLASLPRVDLLSAVHTFEGSVLCCGSDQSLRLVEQSKEKVHVDASVFITQLALPSQPQNYLFAGTEAGAVRAYELPLSGKFSEYQCHSAPVTRIRVSPDEGFLFTVSEDGCLSIFELDQKDPRNAARRKHELALPWAEEILVTRSDLEKKMALVSELKSRVEDLQQHNAQQLKMREANYQDKLKDITAKFNVELEADRKRYEALEHDKSEMEARYHSTLEEMENRHRTKMSQLEQYHTAKIKSEENRLEQLEAGLKASRERRAEQHQRREEIFSQELEEQQATHRRALQLEAERRGLLSGQKDQLVNEFEETKTIMEDDADKDIDELKAAYDQKLAAERLNTLRLQDENAILKKKFSSLNDDIKEQKESIKKRETRQRQLYDTIRSLEKDVEAHMKEIQERESTIADKVKRIFELRKKNQELEKFKFVLDYKIKELKRQIAPRQSEIRTMADQIAQMTQELNGYKKDNAYLLLHVKELKLKLNGLDKEITQQKRSRANLLSTLKRLRSEVGVVQQYLDSPKQLKEAVKALYDSGVTRQENGQEDEEAEEPKSPSGAELDDTLSDLDVTQTPGSPSSSSSNGVGGIPDAHSIYYRQRTYLERSIDSLHSKLEKELEVYRKERSRITQENIALITEINTLRREIQMMKQAQLARESDRRVKKEKKTAKGKALLSTAPVGSVMLSPAGTAEMKSHTGNFAIASPGASSTSSAAPLSSPAFASTLPSARGRGGSAAASSPTAASVLASTAAHGGSAKAQAMRRQIEQQQQVLVALRKQLQQLSSPPGFTVGAVTATPRSPHSPHSPHPPSARKASSPVPVRAGSPVS